MGRFIDDTFHGRKVRIYLPPSYQPEGGKRFPVVYMTDGQDMFEDPHERDPMRASFWNADLAADRLAAQGREAIIVAVWHGGQRRIHDYGPWRFRPSASASEMGGGADEHLRYVADRLQPWVDASFRTKADARHTTVGGSSMGGLFSLYAGVRRPEVFGNVIAMSPSLWIGRSEDGRGQVVGDSLFLKSVASASSLSELAENGAGKSAAKALRIYLDSGDRSRMNEVGSGDGYRDALALRDLLERRGFNHGKRSNLFHWLHGGHAHDQRFWSQRLPDAFDFAIVD